MDYSIKEIAEIIGQFGWTADLCDYCKSTANVPIGPGWFCPCGNYNILSWNNHQITHTNPVYGPTANTIVDGYNLRRMRKKFRLCILV